MTEKEETVTRKYLICDGCGYAITPKTEGYFTLTIRRPREEAADAHFHLPRVKDEKRSWGGNDCLSYWHNNRYARERQKDWLP